MALLASSQASIERIYARHHVLLDFRHLEASSYDPATSAVSDTADFVEVRGLIEGAEALRSFVVNDSMIEEFTRLVSVPATDCVDDNDAAFTPKTGDRLDWPAASALQATETPQRYRVVQVFPRMVNGTVLAFLLSLRNA